MCDRTCRPPGQLLSHRSVCVPRQELLLFPTYINEIHGASWTNLGWTKFVVAAVVVLLDLVSGAGYMLGSTERYVPTVLQHTDDLRSWLLQLSLWSFWLAAVASARS